MKTHYFHCIAASILLFLSCNDGSSNAENQNKTVWEFVLPDTLLQGISRAQVFLNRDGSRALASMDGKVYIYESSSGRVIRTIPITQNLHDTYYVNDNLSLNTDFSDDGNLVLAPVAQNVFALFNTQNGTRICDFPDALYARLSANGKEVVTIWNNAKGEYADTTSWKIRLHNATSGNIIKEVYAVTFAYPNRGYMRISDFVNSDEVGIMSYGRLAGKDYSAFSLVNLRNSSQTQKIPQLETTCPTFTSRDGNLLMLLTSASSSDEGRRVEFWDVPSGRQLGTVILYDHGNDLQYQMAMACTSDKTSIIAQQKRFNSERTPPSFFSILSIPTGRITKSLDPVSDSTKENRYLAFAMSANQKRVCGIYVKDKINQPIFRFWDIE